MASKADKGKGKETTATSTTASSAAATPAAASAGPVIGGSRGDWTAVWSAERNAYYFWNKATGATTWENPYEKEAALATEVTATEEKSAEARSTDAKKESAQSAAKAAEPSSAAPIKHTTPEPTREDYGGIDPDLAFLDPTLAARKSGNAGSFQARFNARTGRFEGDPNRNPDHVSDVSRAKRQNQHYFDYGNWEKTLAQSQEETARKRAAGEWDDEPERKRQPTKKEMAAIRERNKAKKEQKQKGWLLS